MGALVLLVATMAPAQAKRPHDGASRSFLVDVVSGRPETASGGDALVRIDVPRNVSLHKVKVVVDGRDVTDRFHEGDGLRTLLGLVDGLVLGDNHLKVFANGHGFGRPTARLTIVNHPAEGPVFSGPHIPLYCTADAPPWNLGPVDDNCHVATPSVGYQYRTTAGTWAELPDGPLPADLASTTTSTGETVPYIVRIERGTINRAVYETAILHEPGTAVTDPWTATRGWNRRLVYTFGGACGIGHTQATSTGGVLDDTLLSRGYATASATFNVYANNCNDVTSAETAMMVKEHFIETYGVPAFTMGWGASAGTMQQLLIANAYPGILDGILGHVGYPDERSVTVTGHECRFITEALAATDLEWTEEQGQAVTGFARFSFTGGFGTNTCIGYMFFDGVDYPLQCPPHIPVVDRYHPTDNPTGIRCAIADFVSNVYGTDLATGFGRPIIPDTVGVQYGLQALVDGAISPEQFVDLNERIGGLDVEGNRTAERSSADVAAIEVGYATGRINQFDGGLRWTPIIETRAYTDLFGDFHDRLRSWAMRERLLEATGRVDNHVSWIAPAGPPADATRMEALTAMDEWLTNRAKLAERHLRISEVRLTRLSRPDGIVDGCVTPTGERIDEPATLDPAAACNLLFPFHANPRVVAGGPTGGDILKCRLAVKDPADYPVAFTEDQWNRLQLVFPDGVCDWSQPGVGQVPLVGTWLRY